MRVAARRLAANPTLTAAAILSLALGLGANATVFAWVRGVLVDPLPPAVRADGLHVLAATGTGRTTGTISLPELDALRRESPSIAGIAANFSAEMHLAAIADLPAERVFGALVSGEYFDALGVAITHGRAFRPEEDGAPRALPVAVISHGLWQRRFAGRPAAVGETMTINGERYVVIGVAPEDFWGTAVGVDTALWVPLAMHEAFLQRDFRRALDARFLTSLARLVPGAPVARARAEIAAVAARLAPAPSGLAQRSFALVPLWRAPWGAQALLRPMLVAMAGLSALLFLLACVNVAQVQLARAQARERAAAMQIAIGASRARLVREALAESGLLAGAAGAVALLFAWWSARLLERIVPATDFTLRFNVVLDPWVVAFAAGLAAAAAGLIALAPARWGSRADVMTILRQESGTVAGSRRSGRLTAALVVTQVALAVAILTGAGLLLRSLYRFQTVDPGFDPRGVFVARYHLLPSRYPEEAGREFHRALLERLRDAPGIVTASLARWIPAGLGGASETGIDVPEYAPPDGTPARALVNVVGPSYFTTMRIPVLRGRDFGPGDDARARRVAAVSHDAAARFWPGRDPVGAAVIVFGERYEVVAVVGNAPDRRVTNMPGLCLYLPVLQAYRPDMILHVRSADGAAAPLSLVRREMAALDPDLPLTDPRMLSDHVRDAAFTQRIVATLFGLFGALAALVGGLGVYALLAHFVAERRRELAIRLALGADHARLRRLILGRALLVVGAGIVPGVALALWGSRFIATLIVGVAPADPITLVTVPALVLATALVGTLAPLGRVRRLDPAALLRG